MRAKGKARFAYTTILTSDPGRIGRSGEGSADGAAVRIGEGRAAAGAVGAARWTVADACTLPNAASKKARCAARASAADRVGWA